MWIIYQRLSSIVIMWWLSVDCLQFIYLLIMFLHILTYTYCCCCCWCDCGCGCVAGRNRMRQGCWLNEYTCVLKWCDCQWFLKLCHFIVNIWCSRDTKKHLCLSYNIADIAMSFDSWHNSIRLFGEAVLLIATT